MSTVCQNTMGDLSHTRHAFYWLFHQNDEKTGNVKIIIILRTEEQRLSLEIRTYR